MKRLLYGFSLLLAACAAAAPADPLRPATPYPDLGPAPELTNATWLNVDAPLRLGNLRGQVVALEMWTFG
jgi:hypothetical protein